MPLLHEQRDDVAERVLARHTPSGIHRRGGFFSESLHLVGKVFPLRLLRAALPILTGSVP